MCLILGYITHVPDTESLNYGVAQISVNRLIILELKEVVNFFSNY